MSVTIDQQRQRVESEMTKIIDDLDRTVLRKMQASQKWVLKSSSCIVKCFMYVNRRVCVCDITRYWTEKWQRFRANIESYIIF